MLTNGCYVDTSGRNKLVYALSFRFWFTCCPHDLCLCISLSGLNRSSRTENEPAIFLKIYLPHPHLHPPSRQLWCCLVSQSPGVVALFSFWVFFLSPPSSPKKKKKEKEEESADLVRGDVNNVSPQRRTMMGPQFQPPQHSTDEVTQLFKTCRRTSDRLYEEYVIHHTLKEVL